MGIFKGCKVKIDYTNWKGNRREREIIPIEIFFSTTQYHKEPQLLLKARDIEDNITKDFAMKDIHSWEVVDFRDLNIFELGGIPGPYTQSKTINPEIEALKAKCYGEYVEEMKRKDPNWVDPHEEAL